MNLFGILLILGVLSSGVSAITPAALSTCPALQSAAGRRQLLQSSGVLSFNTCQLYFLGLLPTNASSRSAHLASAVESFFSGAGAVLRAAIVACALSQNGESMETTSEDSAIDCNSTLAGLQHTLPTSQQLFATWSLRCSSQQQPSANVSLEMIEAGLLQCLGVFGQALTGPRLVQSASCKVLESLNESSLATAGYCSAAFSGGIDAIQALVTGQTCLGVWTADARATFGKLNGLEPQLRAGSGLTATEQEYLSIQQQSVLVTCVSLFLPSEILQPNTSTLYRLCSNTCHGLQNIAGVLSKFLSLSQTFTLATLVSDVSRHCDPIRSPSNALCAEFNNTFQIRSSRLTQLPSFCLNLSCHYPLRPTTNPDHWTSDSQNELRALYNAAALLFPSNVQAFNGSLLPCGFDCVTFTMSSDTESAIRGIAATCSLIGMICNVISLTAFLLNYSRLTHVVRRLNVYITIGYIIGPGTDGLLAFGSPRDSIACHSDGTIQLNVPKDGTSACAFFATKYLLGSWIMIILAVSLCREWYELILLLDKKEFDQQKARKKEIAYLTITFLLCTLFMTLPLARNTIQGIPSTSNCLLTSDDLFYTITIPFAFLAPIMSVYLIVGLPKLVLIYQGRKGFAKQIRSRLRSASTFRGNESKKIGKNQSLEALESLVFLVLLYIVTVLFSLLTVLPMYSYLFAINDDVTKDTRQHLECLTSQCDTSLCPGLPSVHPAPAIIPVIVIHLVGISISLWAFDWDAYWREHFEKLRKTASGGHRNDTTTQRGAQLTDFSTCSDIEKRKDFRLQPSETSI